MIELVELVASRPIAHDRPAPARREDFAFPRSDPSEAPARDLSMRIRRRALLLWPRLDRVRLARTGGDPQRIARLIGRRSALPADVIVAMLTAGGLD